MPIVVPLPLGGLATELGGLWDRVADIEARRLGAISDTVASISLPGGISTNIGPSVTASIAANGSAVIFAGLLMPAGAANAVSLAVAINGTEIVSTVGTDNSSSVPVPVTMQWATSGLNLGPNTFTLDAYPNVAVVVSDAYLVVIPT